jgi:hypothetical protein
MANTKVTVGIGTKFSAIVADGNCEFAVKAKAGRGVWKCETTAESPYPGVTRHYSSAEITQSLRMAAMFDAARNGSDDYYDRLPLGAIVHYDNSGGEFVRCEVVMGVTVHSGGQKVKCLKPLAMVGSWKPWDLPRRERDGSINLGHHAKNIQDGECFKPSAGCIFGSPTYRGFPGQDPTKMTPLSLEVPEMTPEQERLAHLEQIRQSVKAILDEGYENPARAILAAKEILANVTV